MTLIGALIIMASLIVVVAGGAFLATTIVRSRAPRAAPPTPAGPEALDAAMRGDGAARPPPVAAETPPGNGAAKAELERELELGRADLDQRRRELEREDRLRNLLVSKMSHDLRTPLNSIITLSQLMFDGNTGPLSFEQRKYVEIIHRSGQGLLGLLGEILDLAALEAGRLDLDLVPVDVRAMIDSVAERGTELARRKGLPLRANAPRVPMLVRADEDRLRQVLLNLVEHAVGQTSNGYVELDVVQNGGDTGAGTRATDTIQLRVTDTGAGERPLRAEALEDFLTAPGIGATPNSLGLVLAERLTRLMGGELAVESAPGEGTTFVVKLAAAAGDEASARPAEIRDLQGADLGAPAGAGGDVLLIEDDDLERGQVAGLLERAGYTVTPAKSGDEGIGRMREHHFDAVVLDLVMPGMTGLDVLRSIRSDDRLARTPFVVLSALYMTKSEREVLGPSVAGVVRKGEAIREDLLAYLRRAIDAAAPPPRPAPASRTPIARVLVVEDDDDNLFTIKQVLAALPVDLDTAASGREAIEICRLRCPDLVLMDVELPGLSGLEATRDIRRLPACSDLPIIALSAHATLADREQALAARFADYLPKPVRPRDVLSAVSRALHIGVPATGERAAAPAPHR